jgi:hypothetical protein
MLDLTTLGYVLRLRWEWLARTESHLWAQLASRSERIVRAMFNVSVVRNVISGSGNRSDPRPDRGRLPCMAVGPLSHSTTIKGGQAGARKPTFAVPTVPPQTLATKTDQEGAEERGLAHLATNRRPLTVDSRLRPSPTPCRPPHRLNVYPRNP